MNEIITDIAVKPRPRATKPAQPAPSGKTAVTLSDHIVEIISDSGEGAQRCGQALASIAARMGNGVWTVEIIPAEIRPPARSVSRRPAFPSRTSVIPSRTVSRFRARVPIEVQASARRGWR